MVAGVSQPETTQAPPRICLGLQDVCGSGITVSPGLYGGMPLTAYGFKEYGVVVPLPSVLPALYRGAARIGGWIENMFHGGEDKKK